MQESNCYRTQKDLDIIRQCCVKAAVDLIGHFPDKVQVEGNDGIITTTCKIADKLYQWVIEPSTVKGKVKDIKDKLGEASAGSKTWSQLVKDECHKLQERLNLKLTDFDSDPCPYGDWNNGGAAQLLDTLKLRLKYGSKAGAFPDDVDKSGWKKGSVFQPGYGQGDYPITRKQYGFLVGLHKRLGADHDSEYLNGLTSRQASVLIEELQQRIEAQGNGD